VVLIRECRTDQIMCTITRDMIWASREEGVHDMPSYHVSWSFSVNTLQLLVSCGSEVQDVIKQVSSVVAVFS
jgi:hypothetical protein